MKRLQLLVVVAALSAATVVTAAAPIESADQVRIVSESDIAQSWLPASGKPRLVAGYPFTLTDRTQDVCVNIGFLINADGSTSNFVEMKAWHSAAGSGQPKAEQVRPFAQMAAATISLWRFAPVAGTPTPVYTSAAFAFDGSKTVPTGQILSRCRIDDLPGHVAAAKRAVQQRGSLNRAQLERVRSMKTEWRKGIQKTSRSEIEVGNY